MLKQADVVLALFLQGDRFSQEQKRADFEYYDPITTGDSTLSAVVQSVIAAEVGYHELALQYFKQALYVDLANLHGNTVDGLHIASAGGVWSALVNGFGGMRDHGGRLAFDPRLPEGWESLAFGLKWQGSSVQVRITQDELELSFDGPDEAEPIVVSVRGTDHEIGHGAAPVVVPLDTQGPRRPGILGEQPIIGGRRADGTMITAGVPEPTFPGDDDFDDGSGFVGS